MAEIKAIECPKCGDTHKVVIRPGDFRCASCGTEYFIDDGTVKFGQRPQAPEAARAPANVAGKVALWVFVMLVVGICVLIAYVTSPGSTGARTRSASGAATSTWYSGYQNALYLSPDKTPVLMIFGSKVNFQANSHEDHVAFIDVRDNSTLKLTRLPDSSSMGGGPGGTHVDIRQFVDGEIFMLVEKTQLFKVAKADYAVTDVTQSLFQGQPELAAGVAKIEFMYPSDGQGFKLVTNDGKNVNYDVLAHRVSIKNTLSDRTADPARWAANTDELTAYDFSMPYNSDFPDVPGQLISFRYRSYPNAKVVPALNHYINGDTDDTRWDNPRILADEGVLAHRDFTPGRHYFDYGVLCYDNEYVLISYRATPGKNAPRFVQLLNAKTAAILFTTRMEVLYAPTECVRYKDGFAIVSLPSMWTLSFTGELKKFTPFMFREHD